jgi:cation:H+ antiporter
MTPVSIAAYILLGTALVWIGSEWLEEAADKLSCYYHLPPGMQGGVIAAIGSSSPEIASVVSATLVHGQFDLGVSAIVGSAVFNILVIPAISVLVAGPQGTSRELL